MKWQRVPCESGACPETQWTDEGVYIRDSERPDEVTFFTRQGWRQLLTVKAPWDDEEDLS